MLKPDDDILEMIWPGQAGRRFVSGRGEAVEVVRTGDYDPETETFAGAEIIVDGVVFRGNVMFANPDAPRRARENCILQAVSSDDAPHIINEDGSLLPQIVIRTGPVVRTTYEILREESGRCGCAGRLAKLENHERIALYTRLVIERLQRKCRELGELHDEFGRNWNETMYMMLMRKIGGSDNTEAFTELARRVRYGYISRERNSLDCVEAMLLGTSGLLDLYDDDNYTRKLRAHFEHLGKKYSLRAMMPRAWKFSDRYPQSHPVLRLAQMASFFASREFLFDGLIQCRTVEDVHLFFHAEASEYWSTHYIPSKTTGYRTKRIGPEKANILGINVTVPMLFAYGDYADDQDLKDAAVELLEKIGRESNKIVNGWFKEGVTMENAFDSQAILQLNNEHCIKGLCRRCAIGRRVVRRAYADEHTVR